MKYQHLFFDLDHTLWDFEANSIATNQFLFQHYQLNLKGIESFETFQDVYSVHNDRLWEKFRNGQIKRQDLRWKRFWYTLADLGVREYELAHEMSSAYLEMLPQQKLLMPNAIEVLEYCREKGYQMHLITNGFEMTQWQKLQYSGIASFFTKMITSERSMSMKPHKEIFDFALQETGATLRESIMIGDALDIDIKGAAQAGMDQVFYNPLNLPVHFKPTYHIKDLVELKKIL